MHSSLGWIDFSSTDHDRVKNVLNLLADPGMVDELGIGSIRDSFSDAFFPGVSTLHTRAKYFITIPRILRDFECMTHAQRRRAGGAARFLAEQEDECARLLAEPYAKLSDQQRRGTGIIGISTLDTGVLRKPSDMYWGGLRTYGIINSRLSRAEFCRQLDESAQTLRPTLVDSDKEQGDDSDACAKTCSVRIPSYDERWRDSLRVALTPEEARFLLIQMNQPCLTGTLWSELLQKEKLRKLFLRKGVTFASLPDLFDRKLSGDIIRTLHQAVDFWALLEGAHIRYNVVLQKKFGTPELLEAHEEKWAGWCARMRSFPWSRWSLPSLWGLADRTCHNVRDFTKTFVEQWSEEVRKGLNRKGVTTGLDDLVTRQEIRNKGKKSRLQQTGISVRQWIGISELNYRFPQARRLLSDLQEGSKG